MQVVDAASSLRRALDEVRTGGEAVGLVPTMGALHAGHRSLIERAAGECAHVVVSVFVNPLQFDRADDLARYPRDLSADLALCAAMGVGTVFAPSVAEMYPEPPRTVVSVAALGARWEGVSRPGHFDGVATVVAKLFCLVGPSMAYFGEKDFQQLAIVRRMARDLSMPVSVVGCPTVREDDGLALSSRNALLTRSERRAATVLSRALEAGCAAGRGEDRPEAVARAMAAVVAAEPLARLDYAAAVDARDLSVPSALSAVPEVRLLVAAEVGQVRLIDNCALTAHGGATLAGSRRGRHNRTAGEPAPSA
ncbi:MAG: pantoate--beta-alanine ligase [Acidimicrobiales bacterium]